MEANNKKILEEKMCHELDIIADKYGNGQEMSVQDLEKIDKLYHALKSMKTYHAMVDAEEYMDDGFSGNMYRHGGYSGYRGRAMNGRFVSRNGANSYSEGYTRGYSEAMSQMMMPEYDYRR